MCFPLQVFLLLALLVPVPGSPLLPGLSDLSRMLEPAAFLLQRASEASGAAVTVATGTAADVGGAIITGVGVPVDATAGIGDVISTGGGGVTTVPVATVPVVTTVPTPVPPMMMPTILPAIFAVAVIKALILGKIQFSCLCNAFYAFFFGYL